MKNPNLKFDYYNSKKKNWGQGSYGPLSLKVVPSLYLGLSSKLLSCISEQRFHFSIQNEKGIEFPSPLPPSLFAMRIANFHVNDFVEEYCSDLVGENKKGFGEISMECTLPSNI